jgi:hypothetical protein
VLADLVIAPGDGGDAFVDFAAALYQRVIQAEARIRREAAEGGILDLYRHWRKDDDSEPDLTAEELASRLEPTFLRIDTSFVPVTLSYALGERNEVFGGHALDVGVSDQLEVKGVNLVG